MRSKKTILFFLLALCFFVAGCAISLAAEKEAYEGVTLVAAKDEKSGLWGFMDASPAFVIPPIYDSLDSDLTYGAMHRTAFDQGYEVVGKDKKYFVIDKKGHLVLPSSWDYIVPYPKQGVFVVKKEGKCGLVDSRENFLIQPEWDVISLFSENPEYYHVKKADGLTFGYGIIDRMGHMILPLQKYDFSSFDDSFIKSSFVRTEIQDSSYHPLFGLISIDGKVNIPPAWDYLYPPENGMCIVEKEDKYGAISMDGSIIVSPEWDKITIFSKNTLCGKKGEQYQVIDKSGNPVTAFSSKEIVILNDSLFAFYQSGAYMIEDKSGKTVGHERWEIIRRLSDTLFAAKKNAKWGIIDANEQTVLPFEWDDIISASASKECSVLAIAKKGHAHYFIDLSGALIPGITYDYASAFQDGLCRVLKDGKFGCLNEQLHTVIPMQYDSFTPFRNGIANVSADGLFGRIDTSGRIITPIAYALDDFLEKVDMLAYSYINDYVPANVYSRELKGKYYLLNMKDVMISDNGWDSLSFKPYGIYVKNKMESGFVDYQGNVVIPPVYATLRYESEGIFSYTRFGVCGIVDIHGKETPFPKCESIIPVTPLVLGIDDDHKSHLYDLNGKEITFDHLQFHDMANFREGLAWIKLTDASADATYSGYINTKGELVMKWKD